MNKTQIHQAMKPLSNAILKEGKPQAFTMIAGWNVSVRRMYNSPGSTVSWSPYYAAGESNDGVRGTRGSRDHVEGWLLRHQDIKEEVK